MFTRKILITGAGGFIGRALFFYLQSKFEGADIFLSDIRGSQGKKFICCDLTQLAESEKLIEDICPDWIFHLAGVPSLEAKKLAANELMLENILKAVYRLSEYEPKIVIPASAAEYGKIGKENLPVKETFSASPLSDYGKSKWKQTQTALFYAKQGLDVVIGRIFNILGKNTPPTLVGGAFSQQVVDVEAGLKERLEVKDLDAYRDFIDIDDVCSALVELAENGKPCEIYNICTGTSKSLRELLSAMILFSNKESVGFLETPGKVSQSFDIIGSNEKIRSLSGWKPQISFEESVNRTLKSYRKSKY